MLYKKNDLIIFLGVVFLCLFNSNAQTSDNSTETSTFIGQLNSIDLLSQLNDVAAVPVQDRNEIFITQTGNSNGIEVYTSTMTSEIAINQQGYNNDVLLDIDSKTMVQNVSQNGNGNFYMEYANAPRLNLERSIEQNGTNHSIIIFGSNSITQKLKFNLEGNSKAITIRNFQ